MANEKRNFWYLKKIPLLASLSADNLARLARKVDLREIRRRQVIYLPGDPGDHVFFVNGGRVKVSKVTPDGKELTLAYRDPGELFGELCLVDGAPRKEMAEAMENSLVTQLARPEFERILQNNVSFSGQLVKILAQRRHEVESKIENLVFKDVNVKLAELLLELGQEYGVEDSRGTMIALKITHQEMANLIGSTRETVSLTLSQFKKKSYILTDGRKVIISDHDGLRTIV